MDNLTMNDLVYIIVPVYNSEKYLTKCLDSIFNQSYKNIRIICINDGSTDSSLSILNNYVSQNLIILSKNNEGVSLARNFALDYIYDKEDGYITFLDSDDWIEPEYISNLYFLMKENEVDIVCSSFFFSSSYGNFPYKGNIATGKYNGIKAAELLLLDETIQSHSCTKLYKKCLWNTVRFPSNLTFMEDQATIYKTFLSAKNILLTEYAGYYYRQDNNNSSTNKRINTSVAVMGLSGYYLPCVDIDPCYIELIKAARHALACVYLMLLPYYKKKEATLNEKSTFKTIRQYIKKYKLINEYKSVDKNNMIKRRIYLLCPFAYRHLFKIAKKIKSL